MPESLIFFFLKKKNRDILKSFTYLNENPNEIEKKNEKWIH